MALTLYWRLFPDSNPPVCVYHAITSDNLHFSAKDRLYPGSHIESSSFELVESAPIPVDDFDMIMRLTKFNKIVCENLTELYDAYTSIHNS